MKTSKNIKTVFLDRDGVINEDSPAYIKSPSEFIFIPGSVDAIKRLNDEGLDIIIITNQSLIGRQMIPQSVLDAIFEKMIRSVEKAGGKIKDIFFCPHTPDDGCDCRKPEPGMILKASKKYAIDLSTSIMIGDSAKDILCGNNAGCGYCGLVKTGNGQASEKILAEKNIFPDVVGENLSAVADWVVAKNKS